MKTFITLVFTLLLTIGCSAQVSKQGLPPGLTLSKSGVISGTPAKGSSGAYIFSARACASGAKIECSAPKVFVIIVSSSSTGNPFVASLDGDTPPYCWSKKCKVGS